METDGFNENKIQRSHPRSCKRLKTFLRLTYRKSLIIPFPSWQRKLHTAEVFAIYLLSMMLEMIVKKILGMEGFYYTSFSLVSFWSQSRNVFCKDMDSSVSFISEGILKVVNKAIEFIPPSCYSTKASVQGLFYLLCRYISVISNNDFAWIATVEIDSFRKCNG